MTEPTIHLSLTASRADQVFPTLTSAQIGRIASHGHARSAKAGDVLLEQGDKNIPIFVVISGELETVRPSGAHETLIARVPPGQFTGEVNTLSGRRALNRIRARVASEVIEVSRENVLALVQTDGELSQILMRAFILRRAELFAQGLGDVTVVGSSHSADTLRIKEFLARNAHPCAYIDLDRDADVQSLLDHFHVSASDVPVVICQGETVLRNPTNQEVADCLGFNQAVDQSEVRDLVIVGAGPGGQAGSSSRIENYLGFPSGISGNSLASRAYAQAQKFGAQMLLVKGTRLICDHKPYVVELSDGARIPTRAVLIATGAKYRKLAVETLSRFEGVGVYYGATFIEAQLCKDEEVIVVGGGNSAGQAAVFLAESAKHVFVVVRSDGLADTMSRYLIRRIEETPNITVLPHTEIVALDGAEHLGRVSWRNGQSGKTIEKSIAHLFVMTGAIPNTTWLEGCVVLDAQGFIKTGFDLSADELRAANWPLARRPHLLETSLPGVFAAGDVRGGNVKRVASAVGEGSIAIPLVHQLLRE